MPPSTSEIPESDSASDRDLVIQLWAGQTSALSTIYQRYASLVYTLALRMMGNPEEAEDLTQEVFIHLWQRQKYNPDRGSLGAYLATYTRSRALDRLRVQTNRFRIVRQFWNRLQPGSKSITTMDRLVEEDGWQRIRLTVSQLPPNERKILEIAYFEGCSQSQIAERLGIPLGTVKSRARQGLIRLRDLLNRDDLDGSPPENRGISD
jgi:RNA polymerase sigma-70 factor (ECF subfamily)